MQLSSSQLLQKKVRDVSLRPEGPSLLADDFSLQCPQVTHCVHVKVLDQLGDVLPLHAATFRMEVERFITEETWLSRSILRRCSPGSHYVRPCQALREFPIPVGD